MSVKGHFHARPLRSDAEVEPWGALCARGFSHRPGAPDRFYRKYLVDPTASLEWTRVTEEDGTGAWAGTLRIFDRLWDVNGRPVRCAGLGEVCTDPAFRGKGASSTMMADAMGFMDHDSGCVFSALHAAAGVAPLYAKSGYSGVRLQFSRLGLQVPTASSGGDASTSTAAAATAATVCAGGRRYRVRPADIAAEWPTLQRLHTEACVRMGVTGYTIRSDAYWQRWMPFVAAGQMLVLDEAAADGSAAAAAPPTAVGADPLAGGVAALAIDSAPSSSSSLSLVAAYVVVINRPDGLKVTDFGCAATADAAAVRAFLHAAGVAAAQKAAAAASAAAPPAAATTATLPTAGTVETARSLSTGSEGAPVAAVAAAGAPPPPSLIIPRQLGALIAAAPGAEGAASAPPAVVTVSPAGHLASCECAMAVPPGLPRCSGIAACPEASPAGVLDLLPADIDDMGWMLRTVPATTTSPAAAPPAAAAAGAGDAAAGAGGAAVADPAPAAAAAVVSLESSMAVADLVDASERGALLIWQADWF